MSLATLIFSAIAAVGTLLAVVVASQPLLRIFQDRHRREDRMLQSYAEVFGRLYRFVMNDLDSDGKVKAENAKIFGEIADNVMYLHCAGEANAWQRYRDVNGL